MDSKRWQDHFPQEAQTLQASVSFAVSTTPNAEVSSLIAKPAISSLNQALEKAILPAEKYFLWAQNEYQLPCLKLDFFADHPIDGKVWQKYQAAFPWNQDCLPIAEWDGHLIVACLEPKKLPQILQAIYILCPLSGLKQLWQVYQHSNEFNLSDESLPMEPPIALESSLDGLDGLSPTSPPKEVSDFDDFLLSSNVQVRLEKTSVVEESNLTPPLIAADPVSNVSTVSTLKKPATLVGAEREIYILDIFQKDKPQMFLTESRRAFLQLKDSFTRSLLLSCDTKALFIKPLNGDQDFVSQPLVSGTPLATASIFRIVEQTQKPFHGPISMNEINGKFFEVWNKGIIPNHVTLVPLINNDKVIGMLMGLGEATAFNRTTLQLVEKTAQELLIKFIPSKVAKAA